jgi:hypothetical protein
VVYPKFLENLDQIMSTGEIGADLSQSRWPPYEAILMQSMTWPEGSRPIMLPEGDLRLSHSPILAVKAGEWMEDTKWIAVAGYRPVLEDGRDMCNSESDAEYSHHGEKWSDSEMDTPDMMDEKGKPVLGRARMTMEQVNAPCAQARTQSVQEPVRLPTPVTSVDYDLTYELACSLWRFKTCKGSP